MPEAFQVVAAMPDDLFHSVAQLAGALGAGPRRALLEGFIQANTFGVVVRFGDEATPETAAVGLSLVVNGALGVGPAKDPAAAWPLARIWVRNAAAGSNATIVVLGVVG